MLVIPIQVLSILMSCLDQVVVIVVAVVAASLVPDAHVREGFYSRNLRSKFFEGDHSN